MPDIDPWGDVEIGNYKQKMEKFGIDPIEEVEDRLPDHRFIRRNIVFGHRDLDTLLDARDEGEEFAMMTGIMPSGIFHFGHKCVVDQIKMYQQMGAQVTIAAADIEAYNTRDMSLEEARELVIEEYLKNYAALGIDLENVDFYFQSKAGNDHLMRSKPGRGDLRKCRAGKDRFRTYPVRGHTQAAVRGERREETDSSTRWIRPGSSH